jgi:hypothetical protein
MSPTTRMPAQHGGFRSRWAALGEQLTRATSVNDWEALLACWPIPSSCGLDPKRPLFADAGVDLELARDPSPIVVV